MGCPKNLWDIPYGILIGMSQPGILIGMSHRDIDRDIPTWDIDRDVPYLGMGYP